MMSLGNLITLALCVILTFAAAVDIWKLRIPNVFPIAIILLFPAWVYHAGWSTSLWQNWIVFTVAFLGGAVIFSRGWLGGGDVKLLAATALWFDFKGAASLFLFVAIGGVLLSIVFVVLRRVIPARLASADIPSLKPRGPIPYGVAIAGGAVLAIIGGQISPQAPWYREMRIAANTDHMVSAASIMISWARD
ncbi:peptidase [Sphingomonas panacisoli]|uniref:Peptidase n=1 Tax=Sphingomonas panacisoli TaxID=1813879 RepID=A0A5B8LMN3_9SPHN|nr:prepilin peptidase [Sphingomonas panacisoli]QDZ08642.1 peptidase [Sphingomonas panacisoli]